MDIKKYIMLIPISLYMIIFATMEINARSNIDISGTIIESKDIHNDRFNYQRYFTMYLIQNDDKQFIKYKAENNDHSLKRSLPVGSIIKKSQGELKYTIDGELIDDFPILFYSFLRGLGISVFAIYMFILIRLRLNRGKFKT